MPLKPCIKATANLDDGDVASILDSFDSYSDRMNDRDAATAAIDDEIASLEREIKETLDLVYETYPDLREDAAPRPAIQPPDDPAFQVVIQQTDDGPIAKVRIDRAAFDIDADNFGYPADTQTLPDNDPLLQDTQEKYTIDGTQHPELPQGQRDYQPERKVLHEQILGDFLSEGQITEIEEEESGGRARPIAIMMGGGGAAGKGTILKKMQKMGIVPADGLVHIDPDEIKKRLPEFKDIQSELDSRAAPTVHEESSDLGKILINRAKARRFSVVIDKTLGNPRKALAQFAELKRAGYEVRLVGATLPIEEALIRALERYYGIGRLPAVDAMLDAHIKFNRHFAEYAAEVDHAFLYDNEGSDPVRIASTAGGNLQIEDEIRYNNAVQRGTLSGNETTIRSLQDAENARQPGGRDQRTDRQGAAGVPRADETIQEEARAQRPLEPAPEPGTFVQRSPVLKAKPKRSLESGTLRRMVQALQRDFPATRAVTFHVFDTQEDAFGPGSVDRDGLLQGGYYAGRDEFVLIAENIKDMDDAIRLFRHETVGHYGLRKLLNTEGQYDRLLKRAYAARNGELRNEYRWVARVYPDLVAANDVRTIADEMLARAAETKSKSNLITRIYDQIIKLLNKIGLVRGTISQRELRSLIRLSEANLRRRPGFGSSLRQAESSDMLASRLEQSEYEQALAKGLPMDQESRMQRAREMGFGEQVWYHANTGGIVGQGFDASRLPQVDPDAPFNAFWFLNEPNEFAAYPSTGNTITPVRIRGKAATIEDVRALAGKGMMPDQKREALSEQGFTHIVWVGREPINEKELKETGSTRFKTNRGGTKELRLADDGTIDLYTGSGSFITGGYTDLADFNRLEPEQETVAVFDPTAIRSINAAFDPDFTESSNLLARRVDTAPVGTNLGMPEETWREFFVRQAQNNFNRILKLQETITDQGGTVTPESDVYRAEELSSGKISFRLNQLDRNYMQPLLQIMDENKITLDELDNFQIANHAQERNAYIASINDDMQDGGSGMTNAEAQAFLDGLGDRREALEEAAAQVYAVNDATLDNLVDGGHLTEETAEQWRDRWSNYVPLKGKLGEEGRPGTGTGYSIAGAGIQRALGRGEGNVAESPTAHSFAQAESAIVRTEKTKVGQALVQLIRDNPDPNFWTISQRNYKKFVDAFGEPFEGYEDPPEGLIENLDYHRVKNSEGKVVYRLDPNYKHRDDVFAVMVDGKELLVQIKDPILMEQLKRMNTTQLNAVVRGFGMVNRYLAMINTALNPEFVITNFERDFQTAMVNLGGEHSAEIAAKVAKNIPSAIRGIWQETFDTKGKSVWRSLYKEMQEEGGTIGFFGLEDIDAKVRKIQNKLIDRHGILGRTKKGVATVRDVVLDANLSVENAARLAAYKVVRDEAIANGMSAKDARARAASVAKNLTVNFNRKGELAPVLNSAYLFYNASIQGSARILTALRNPRVRKIVGGIMATSFALALYNRNAGGDDDDEIPHWDKISDYTKQTNLIIMHPDGSGNYSKIRLPYGYNVFYYAGTAMHDMMFDPRKGPIDTTMNTLSAFLNAFNPIQGADLLDTVTPTFLKPYEQDARNINFMAAPLKPDYPFDPYERPESQKFFKSTNPTLVAMMQAINEATGGDETHSGLVDISPEIVKHYVSWLTGGAGLTATRTLGTFTNLVTGDEIDMKNVPLLRTLGGKPGSHFDTQRYYQAMKEVAAVEAQLKILKGTDEYADYRAENAQVHKLAFHRTRYKNRIKRLREERDRAYADDDQDLAKEKREAIRQVMMEFSMKYDDAIEAQQ